MSIKYSASVADRSILKVNVVGWVALYVLTAGAQLSMATRGLNPAPAKPRSRPPAPEKRLRTGIAGPPCQEVLPNPDVATGLVFTPKAPRWVRSLGLYI